MAPAPASGLLSPSPSMSDLNKAAESSAGQKEKELTTDANGLKVENAEDGPLQSVENDDAAVAENEADRTGGDIGIDLKDAERPGKSKKKKRKSRRRSLSGSRPRSISPSRIILDESGSGSESDSSFASFKSRLLAIPSRRRDYVRAYGAYVESLEQRITELEKGKPTRSRRGSNASAVSSLADITKIAIPELKLMTWEEYLKDKGKPIPDEFYAIDVLIDEPILYHQRTRKKHSHESADSGEANEIPSSAARRSEGLPSRIRINSDMILQHLWRISKKRFAAGKPLYPRTILRPFKVLYLMENEIRELFAELEAKVNSKAQAPADEQSMLPDTDGKPETVVAPPIFVNSQVPQDNTRREGEAPSQDNPPHETIRMGAVSEDKADEELPPEVVQISGEESQKTAEENVESKIGDKTEEKAKTFDERLESQEAVNDLRCLIGFIDKYLKKVQGEFDRCERQKVRFSELWHLLKPDQLLYVNEKNCPQHIWRVVQAIGGRPYLSPWVPRPSGPPPPPGNSDPPPQQEPKMVHIAAGYDTISPFCLDCEYIDYSGVRFGPIFRKFYIDPYDDEMDIKDLTAIPYNYAKKFGLVNEEELKGRGQRFLQFIEPQHRYYSGKTLIRTPFGIPLIQTPEDGYYRPGPPLTVSEETVESEVMVDFDRAFNSNPKWSPRLGEDVIFELMDGRECREPADEGNLEDIDYDMKWDQQIRNDTMALINLQSSRYFSKEEVPTGNDLLLLPSRVYAFILRSRKWAALDVDSLREIKARKNGFEDLELPSGHKDVVQALVQTHFRRTGKKGEPSAWENEEQFDLVRDKGKGLIILLHGAPGVGKTSTAECVAESNNVPLLPITCGDLGITAQDVERKLEMNFRLAQAWGCVLLLDEADVFLAQRTSSDLERNAVVSVFLRVLEYYEGILFLTTNRVGAFDEAFKSRIHISLFYPWLNAWQTTRIWDMQMRRIKERIKAIEIDTRQILEYAKLHFETQCRLTGGTGWNGRQIRNAFQSATALAQFECKIPSDPVHLQVRHFEIVAKAAAEFDDYLIRTTGHSDAERAAFNMMRTDSFSLSTSNPMSLESMMQARGYASAAPAHMASFGSGMGGQMPAQTAFGGPTRSNFGAGQQGMQGMNQGNFGMGMGQSMPFQQAGYSTAGPSVAQAAFMGGPQMGNSQQMWAMQAQAQAQAQTQPLASMTSMQQGGMGSMPQQAQQVSGQALDTAAGQQAPGQLPGQGQQPQGGNIQGPQGFNAAAGFRQYPQQGQGYQM